MPRTRTDTDRETKINQILDAAEDQLRTGGVPRLSVVGIARSLGVAQNSIYWYFPTRDHLLVAVLHRVAKQWLHELGELGAERYLDQIVGAVDRLAEFEPLASLVTSQSHSSPVLTDFAKDLESSLCALLRETLRPHVADKQLEVVTEAVLTLAQGALARGLEPGPRHDLLSFAIRQLVDADRTSVSRSTRRTARRG